MYRLSSWIIILCFSTIGFAQHVEFNKANFPDKKVYHQGKKNYRIGNTYYERGSLWWGRALPYYLKAHQQNPNHAALNYKIGTCLLKNVDKLSAIPYFEKAISLGLDKTIYADAPYLLGQGYHLNSEFDRAIEQFTTYKNTLTPDQLSQQQKAIDKKIQECTYAKEVIEKPVRVTIENLGPTLNSMATDHSPIVNADETVIIFTSRRAGGISKTKAPEDLKFYEDIYIAYKNDTTKEWQAPKNLGKDLNTIYHDASVGLSGDGQKLLTYKDKGGGDIYESKLEGDIWSKPKKIHQAINTKYHESSASLSFDSKKLFFVSNRPSGLDSVPSMGGRDIYVAQIDDSLGWSNPVNIGNVINTEYDEEGVFMHPDGKTLFFSSKGHQTMGGYDVFKTTFDETTHTWSAPVNLGYPINTPDDDVFFSIGASGVRGYYTSAKKGGSGEQDLYVITYLSAEKELINSVEDDLLAKISQPQSQVVVSALTVLKGMVMDEKTKAPLQAKMIITDIETNTEIATFVSNSKTGKYLITLPSGKNYSIRVEATGYMFHSENMNIKASNGYQEIEKDFYLKKMEVGMALVLKNIFFDFGKSTLRKESIAELDRLVKLMKVEYPTMTIEISGHTDNRSSWEYNKRLSQARAQAVVTYLINHGISKERMVANGYSFDKPIATNDTDEGRQLNRRTEFKILSLD